MSYADLCRLSDGSFFCFSATAPVAHRPPDVCFQGLSAFCTKLYKVVTLPSPLPLLNIWMCVCLCLVSWLSDLDGRCNLRVFPKLIYCRLTHTHTDTHTNTESISACICDTNKLLLFQIWRRSGPQGVDLLCCSFSLHILPFVETVSEQTCADVCNGAQPVILSLVEVQLHYQMLLWGINIFWQMICWQEVHSCSWI